MKNKYFVVGDDSSELALPVIAVAVAADPAVAAVTSDDDDDDDDEHNSGLFPPPSVSLVRFSAISDAMFVNCGPINAWISS